MIAETQINSTLSLMKTRGPDLTGTYRNISGQSNLVFLHSRLSITGSDECGRQPLSNNRYALVFNGEIYNYLELYRKYSSTAPPSDLSDTEVLFHLINEYSSFDSLYTDLDGMWSFACFDIRHQKLVLSRDIFGEKPLFFFPTAHGVFFGSSPVYIQALANISLTPDYYKLDLFLQYDFRLFTSPTESFAAGIKSVSPGTHVTISSSLDVTQTQYFCPYKLQRVDIPNDPTDIHSLILHTLRKSFSRRLDSQQTSTLFLSGGVDSASIAALSYRHFPYLKYLSVANNDPRYNEIEQIEDITRLFATSDHHFITPSFTASSIIARLTQFSLQSYSPLPFQNYLLFDAMCVASKSHGSKVVFSGLGGDELFAGYLSHWQFYFQDLRSNIDTWSKEYIFFKDNWLPYIRNRQFTSFSVYSPTINPFAFFEDSSSSLITNPLASPPVYPGIPSSSFLIDKLNIDTFYSTLPPHLFAADLVSMSHGLECRCPFLSKDLFFLARSIPVNLLMQNGYNKSLLRETLSPYLPRSVSHQSDKKGFNFEFSSKYISDFAILNDFLLDCPYLSDRLDLDTLLRQHNTPVLSNSQSKLFFRAVSIASFLSIQ